MEARAATEQDDRDWRLTGVLGGLDDHRALHAFVEHLRDPEVLREVRAAVDEDVVITHDGDRLFAYASGRGGIEQARRTIEAVLARDGMHAELSLSHFSGEVDEWVDPDAPAAPDAGTRAAGPETRTLVAVVGRMIREELEQSMRSWADQLGLRCEIVEHPHLLSSQVAFTVTGSPRKLDEFAAGLSAEERRTILTETGVMASPL
jgi:hypothetical protein